MCATRRANITIAVSTPRTTPIARLPVHTVATTVTSMTRVSGSGMTRRVRGWTECQSNVPTDTMIITATSAAMGMRPTMSPSTTTRTSRNTPASSVDSRVRAPDSLTLIIVWPIIAQPPIPPKKPVTRLATPWPQPSRVLSEWVSVMSSTSLAVMSDSMSPTSAIASAYGAMIWRVSSVSGTSGRSNDGNDVGSSPWPATSGTFQPTASTTTVIATIAISGAGTTVVRRGKPTMITMPTATSGYTSHGTPIRCGICAEKMRIASALTKPIITDRGMNRISLATPSTERTICSAPPSRTVAMR